MADKFIPTVKCKFENCFQNRNGMCWLLEEAIKGKMCPFYKSWTRVELEERALRKGDMDAYRQASRVR